MQEDGSWRRDISFSDRLDKMTQISNGLVNASVTHDYAESRRLARELEKEMFDAAASREDYDGRCNSIVPVTPASTSTPTERAYIDDGDDQSLSPNAEQFGKYVNARHYRDGLFSFIYKAVNPSAERNDGSAADHLTDLVALKVTTPSMMAEPHDSSREVRILQKSRHENIIPLLDSFKHSGSRLVLVFPFLPYDLVTLLSKRMLNHEMVQSHLRGMFDGLRHLHSLDIIHRDIKPSNILLKSPSGPAFLADFGIAWAAGDPASEPPDRKITDVGTTSYRPPELLFGNKSYNSSLDMWAAGCVVAEAASLSTETLFDAGDLGSELALIQSMFTRLGTPTLETWPEAANFRDWGKMEFHKYPGKSWEELLPKASQPTRDLVARLVRFESGRRLTADQALRQSYFS